MTRIQQSEQVPPDVSFIGSVTKHWCLLGSRSGDNERKTLLFPAHLPCLSCVHAGPVHCNNHEEARNGAQLVEYLSIVHEAQGSFSSFT